MTGLSDTERETLLAKVIGRCMTWAPVHCAVLAKAIVADGWRHADELADATTAATLAERERLLGMFSELAEEHWDWKAGQVLARRLRDLIAQERAQ